MKENVENFRTEVIKYNKLKVKREKVNEEIRLQNLQVLQSQVYLKKLLFEQNKKKPFLKEGENLVYVKELKCLVSVDLNEHKQVEDVNIIDVNVSIIEK